MESVSLTGTFYQDTDIWIEVPVAILSAGKSLIRRNQQNSTIRKAAKINNEMARKALLSISDLKNLLLREDLDAAIIALQKYTPPVFKAVKGYGLLKPYWVLRDEE